MVYPRLVFAYPAGYALFFFLSSYTTFEHSSIKPRSPHLNGKVERSQRTDLEEFYAGVDLESADLKQKLEEWQDYYNHFRVHGSLNGKTPWEKWMSLANETPIWEEIEQRYDSSKE